ncbi:MAG: cell division protein FtsZ [Bacteroidetes bacterium]|nr:cell division protein FtsZ [Bacteroidota bacterium]
MTFEISKPQSSIIKVIGVGGGGSNAVNHMFRQGIRGVDFIVCNTDQQALDASPVPVKIQLGSTLTEGRGAGSIPEVGKNAAIENIEELKDFLGKETKMVFVTAGMGGGTGTGAAPVIAKAARELGILTVGIVTVPFTFEGRKRRTQAMEGLEELKNSVDTILVISNDKLREIHGNLKMHDAFAEADNVLTTAAKGIAEIITVSGYVNVDFADVHTVMNNGGSAIMGAAIAEGEGRAMRAVEGALSSPLLNDNRIVGAKHILINISAGNEGIHLDEIGEIIDHIQDEAGSTANVIFGTNTDDSLGDSICVTLIATGFNTGEEVQERVVMKMDETPATQPQMPVPVAIPQPEASITNTNKITESKPDLKLDKDESVLIENAETRPELMFTMKTVNTPEPVEETQSTSDEDHLRKSKERLENLRKLSGKINTPAPVNDLENIPAFRRRNVVLDKVDYSDETEISRYTLSENTEEKKIEIRPNNSFLHDNVD